MKFICALIVFVTLVTTASAGKRRRCFPVDDTPDDQPGLTCGEHERYEKCSTLCGEKTCDRRTDLYCGLGCQERCLCEDGYIRDANNVCILEEDCPADQPGLTCGEHEVYEKCSTLCGEKTCDRRTDLYCGVGCQERCLCEEGYIRDANNVCILEEECPATTPICAKAHESYTDCGTACPVTCENKDKPIICTRQCVQGCFCENGYVRDYNGECILPAECPVLPPPPQCGPNQEYSLCGANSCEPSCSTLNMNYQCKPICTAGCICQEGYIKDDNGVCILVENCPATIPICSKAHESYTDCGTACPLTCKNKDNPPLICTANCVPDCFCDEGYVRDDNGDCIAPTQCPVTLPACSHNEEYSECGANGCQNTCSNPTLSQVCKAMCIPGCVCRDGFIRDDSGACIAPSQCPQQAGGIP